MLRTDVEVLRRLLPIVGSFLVVFFIAVTCRSVRADEADGRSFELTVRASRVSLRADDAPLREVLAVLGRKSGVTVVVSGAVDTLVTTSFIDLPLDEAVRRLSRSNSVVLIYDPAPTGGTILSEVRVIGLSGLVAPALGAPRGDSRVEFGQPTGNRHRVEDRVFDPHRASSHFSILRRAVETLMREQGESEAARNLLSGHDSARERAVQTLVREQGAVNVGDILREVIIGDPAPLVRRAAIRAVMSEQNLFGVTELGIVATRDPASLVRREAIRLLGSMNSPEAGEILRSMRTDPDRSVRSAADSSYSQWHSRAR